MTYTQRAYLPDIKYWEFYARSRSPIGSDNITVVFSESWTNKFIQVFAVKGVSSTIIDQNLSQPLSTTCPASPCSISVATSTSDLVVATTAIDDVPPCNIPSGFVLVKSVDWWEVDYAMTGKTKGSVLFTCTTLSPPFSIVADAISLHGSG